MTDLEYRVWTQYLLSADDYGVMRFSAVSVQADNDALHTRPTRTIQRCLERLVDIGLLVDFEHQKRKYLCQLDWHTFQKIKHPRATVNPVPAPEVLRRCDLGTAALFIDAHPGFRKSVENPYTSHGDDVHHLPPDDAASEAPLITAKAKAEALCSTSGREIESVGSRERFAAFWKAYPRKVGKDAAWKAWQKRKPTAELLAQMLAALSWQAQQPDWLKDGGQFIPHPSTYLNQARWDDEPVVVTALVPANKRIAGAVAGGQAFLNRSGR